LRWSRSQTKAIPRFARSWLFVSAGVGGRKEKKQALVMQRRKAQTGENNNNSDTKWSGVEMPTQGTGCIFIDGFSAHLPHRR